MPIHYSEGAFPLSLYSNNYITTYKNGYHLEHICGCNWNPMYNIQDEIKKHSVALMVTDVAVQSQTSLTVTISFSDGTSEKVELCKGTKYKIQYLDNGVVNSIVGVVTGIGKVNTNGACTCNCCTGEDYIITVDASVDYASNVVNIRTSNIRGISKYNQYADEDTTILNARTAGATVAGDVTNLSISSATVDKDGNITAGTLTNAVLDKDNCIITDSCAVGMNGNGHEIVVAKAHIIMGTAVSGTISSGKVDEFTISGGVTDPVTKITTNCLLTAKKGTIVATGCKVVGAKAYKGKLITPILENSTVTGGKRSGKDMITTGATVIGEIAYNGAITGGTLYGGVAVGLIDGEPYAIINGITTGGTTLKSTVTGGRVVGGKKIENTTVGATVYGGVAEAGVTTCGTTKLGDADSFIRPESVSLPGEIICKCPKIYPNYHRNLIDVIIWWKTVQGYPLTSNYDTVYNGG